MSPNDAKPANDSAYAIIDDPDRIDVINDIMDRHGIAREHFLVLGSLSDQVLSGEVDPLNLVTYLSGNLSVDKAQATVLSREVLHGLLLPLAPWVPAIKEAADEAAKTAGEREATPATPVTPVAPVPPPDPLTTLVTQFRNEVGDARLADRFSSILERYREGRLGREQALHLLTKSRKTGGLEMNPEASGKLLGGIEVAKVDRVAEVAKMAEVTSPKRSLASILPPREFRHKLPPRKVVRPLEALQKEFEKEVAAHEARVPAHGSDERITLATNAVMLIRGATRLDDAGKEKLRGVVETYLRGVRDIYAVRSLLEGLGFSGGDLPQALETMEGQREAYEARHAGRKAQEKQSYVEERSPSAKVSRDRQERLAREETAALSKRYEAVAKIPPREQIAPAAPTGARVSAARLPEAEVRKALTRQAPSASGATPNLSKRPKIGKESVRDVVPPKRLTGPVDELRDMTLASFRRLAPSAEGQMGKIQEFLRLLEKESYAKRLQGVSAWRMSPLYQTYTALVLEALQRGVPIGEVLKMHREAHEDVPTSDELNAIVKLNGMLHV